MLHCPNCNSPVGASEPLRCEVCGYRQELAREFFWLYLGGGTIVVLGLATGTVGVIAQGGGPEHWTSALRGWFPLAPWPRSHHWLAFLVVGILLTMGGLGVTRRRRAAWVGLLALAIYQSAWIVLAALGQTAPAAPPGIAAALLGATSGLLLLVVRIGLALRRTPPRDAARMQRLAQNRRDDQRHGPKGSASGDK